MPPKQVSIPVPIPSLIIVGEAAVTVIMSSRSSIFAMKHTMQSFLQLQGMETMMDGEKNTRLIIPQAMNMSFPLQP